MTEAISIAACDDPSLAQGDTGPFIGICRILVLAFFRLANNE